MPAAGLAQRVQRWQRQHGRHDLPWQGTRDPYRIWLSEVMLQQTQVGTVLDYYMRFLARFPDVQALAAASLDDVLGLWSGLGYYGRARNLHRCAQEVVGLHGGQFPASSAMLATLPGIGRSTAAAIAAFAFGERAAVLDGNVKRVLTRALGFEGDLACSAQEQALWKAATELLPLRGIESYTQGLMDLGATLCLLRRPACERCPLAADCVALAQGRPQAYPVKTRKIKRGQRSHALLWLERGSQVWLVQRPSTGVWAGLWSFPEYEDAATLDSLSRRWPGRGEWLPAFDHTLTHIDWTLRPLRWHWPLRAARTAAKDLPAGRWFEIPAALAMGLPAPVRRLLEAS